MQEVESKVPGQSSAAFTGTLAGSWTEAEQPELNTMQYELKPTLRHGIEDIEWAADPTVPKQQQPQPPYCSEDFNAQQLKEDVFLHKCKEVSKWHCISDPVASIEINVI